MSDPVSPNMGLDLPVPTQSLGPGYASSITNDMSIIDGHDHIPISDGGTGGVYITPPALDLNSDVSFQDNNATNLRSTRLAVNSSTLGGVGDLNCVYDVNGNLWFNNGSGVAVQITNGSVVNVSAPISYNTFNTSGNYAINSTDPYVLISCNSTSNTITVTLPAASSVAVGRFYIVKDSSGTSATNAITVSPAGLDTLDTVASSLTIADNYWSVGFVSDGTSNWHLLKWNKFTYLNGETLNFNTGSLIGGNPTTSNSTVLDLGGATFVQGLLAYSNVVITGSNSPYTINPTFPLSASSICYLVSTSGARTINLPATTSTPSGMILIIKDVTGSGATNNITLVPSSGDSIEGLAANYLIQSNYGQVTLYNCYRASQNWAFI